MGALDRRQDNFRALLDPYGAATHEVFNQPVELADYNLYDSDAALKEAVKREGAAWAMDGLETFGARAGSTAFLELGVLANSNPPELETHDRYGRRIDLVRYHPSYHALMKASIEDGLHSSPWTDPGEGAHVARAARSYMHTEVEAGHGCPITMTFAATPCLKLEPDLAQQWLPKVQARVYDPRNVPVDQKEGATIGMAMTEKQGGSDVRANTTRAIPVGAREGATLTSSSATSSSFRRRCAMRSSCWRRRPAASPVFSCRAGVRTEPRTRFRSSASSGRWATCPMRRARRSCAARSAGWSGPRAGGCRRSSRWSP